MTTFDATLGGVQANGSWELQVANTGGGNWDINTGVLILPHASHQSTIATGPLYKTTPISIWNGQLLATDTAMFPFNINSTLYSQGESFLNGTENLITLAPVASDVINHCGYWWGLKGKSQMVTDNISIVPSGATFDNFATEVVQWDGSIDIPSGLDLASSNRQTMDVGCYVALGGEIIGDGYVAQKGQIFACFFDKDLGRLVYCWCNKVAAGRRGRADAMPIPGALTSAGDLFQSSFNSGAYAPIDLDDYRLILRGNNSGSEWTIECANIDSTGEFDNSVVLHSFSEIQTEVFADNVGAGINPFVITPAYYPLNEILTPSSGDCPIQVFRRGMDINTGDLDTDLNTQPYPIAMVQDIAPVVSVDGSSSGDKLIQPAPYYFLKVGKISGSPKDVAPDAGLDDANAPATENFGKMIGYINRDRNTGGDRDVSRGVLASGRPQANTTWAIDLYESTDGFWDDTSTTDGDWNVQGYFQGDHETDTLLTGNTNLTYIRIPELPISMKGVKNSSDFQAGDDTIVGAGFPLGHGTIIDNIGALSTPTSYYQPTQSSHQFIGNAGEMRLTQLSVQFVNGEGQLRTDLIGESYVALHFIGEETAVAGGQVLPNENAV